MGTLQGLGSPHATGDAGTLMSSHSRYGQNINQDYLKEWWKTGWWERRARQQGRWEENWAEQVPSKVKLIPSKQTEDGAILSCMVFQQKSVVYSLWRIPCFSSWVQAPQHTKAAPPSNWEKLDGPVPFSMISFPIYKGSKTPRNTTGNWREAGRRRNYREQQRPPSIPERQKRKREYKVPGCDQALLNSSTR